MLSGRDLIDPNDRYPSDGLRTVERNALAIIDALPVPYTLDRTRNVIELDSDDVVVIITAEALELRTPTVEWTMGSYGPAHASRLWKRVRWKRRWDVGELRSLITEAIQARHDEFAPCGYCGERVPPEDQITSHLGKGAVCHPCASKHEQVVF